jgi:hypothetical protein
MGDEAGAACLCGGGAVGVGVDVARAGMALVCGLTVVVDDARCRDVGVTRATGAALSASILAAVVVAMVGSLVLLRRF